MQTNVDALEASSMNTPPATDVTNLLRWRRTIQIAWLVFTAFVVILAVFGVNPYLTQVILPCTTQAQLCLASQLSSATTQAIADAGIPLASAEAQHLALNVAFGSVFAILTAAFGMWRRPTHPAVIWMSFGLVALGTSEFIYALAMETPSVRPLAAVLRAIQVVGLAFTFWLLPNEHFAHPRQRWPLIGLILLLGFMVAFFPANALLVGTVALIVMLLCGGILVVHNHSLPTAPGREQMTWALMAFLLLAGVQVIGQPFRLLPLINLPLDDPLLALTPMMTVGLVLLLAGIACLAVALLRDELTQLEFVFNRTLVYSLLTLFVICAYGLIVGSLSMIFQATGSFWLSVIATGFVAVIFQPLRAWVQRLVNQLLYGQRDEPVAVLARLGERLEEVQTADALLPDMAKTIALALKLPYVAIAVNQTGESVTVAEFATRPDAHTTNPAHLLTIPMIHQRETLGALKVAYRSPDDPFSAIERALLMNIARQASTAVRAVQLTADLQQSRQRLVAAIEEERRRLRRDLHDGLGPVLAALTLQSEATRDLVRHDPTEAESLLDSMADQAQAATQEIRRLVYDLRPPALDDLGLMDALRTHAIRYMTSGIHIEICAPEPLPTLPAAVEVAVFRIVIEAMTNVIRHAHATHCWVALEITTSLLILTVRDNGCGLPVDGQAGVGILSMRERCTELGGSFVLDGQGGVQIKAILPL